MGKENQSKMLNDLCVWRMMIDDDYLCVGEGVHYARGLSWRTGEFYCLLPGSPHLSPARNMFDRFSFAQRLTFFFILSNIDGFSFLT